MTGNEYSSHVSRKLTLEQANARFLAAGLTPLEPYVDSHTKRLTKCNTCGNEVRTSVANLSGGRGCRTCGYERVRQKLKALKTDLAAIEARYAAVGLTPLEPWVNANVPRLCRCNTCGYEYKKKYASVFAGAGCYRCGRKLSAAKNTTPQETVDALLRSKGLEPIGPYEGSATLRLVCCLTCNKESRVRYTELNSGKRLGCRYCSYSAMGARKLLPIEEVDQVFRDAGLEPIAPYEGSAIPRRCICTTCLNEVSPAHASLKYQGGCKFCAPVGIDRNAAGVIYLLENSTFDALKIGITSRAARKDRVGSHEQFGWGTVHVWDVETGAFAEQVETAVLRWWRSDLQLPPHVESEHMPQGGYSETVDAGAITIHTCIEQVNQYIRQLSEHGFIDEPECSIDGCKREAVARRLCASHYQRLRKYGDPLYKRSTPERKPCSVSDCERQAFAKGMCSMHYKKWKRRDDNSKM